MTATTYFLISQSNHREHEGGNRYRTYHRKPESAELAFKLASEKPSQYSVCVQEPDLPPPTRFGHLTYRVVDDHLVYVADDCDSSG